VADQNRALVGAERRVEPLGVEDQRADLVTAVRGEPARRIAAQEGSHHAPAALGQVRPEVTPRPRRIRIAVQAERERCAGGTPGECRDGEFRQRDIEPVRYPRNRRAGRLPALGDRFSHSMSSGQGGG